jgi:hypothetical protein
LGTTSAGNVIVLAIAKDNTNTTDGNFNEVTSVTDPTGQNTWTKAREFTNGQGGAAAGITVAVFFTVVVSPPSSATINFSAAITAKAASAWQFTIAAGSSVSVAAGTNLARDGTTEGSMTLSGLANREYLWFRGAAAEDNTSSSWSPTTGYTAITRVGTSGSGFASNATIAGEFIIFTGTSQTSSPTNDTNSDRASVFLALQEDPSLSRVAAFGPPCPPAFLFAPPGLVVI